MEKTELKVGDKVYLKQITGSYMVDMVKRPYTVVKITPKMILVQECQYIWPIYHCSGNLMMDRPDLEGQRVQFYDTIPEAILPNPEGQIEELYWHSKRGMWGTKGRDSDYPEYAFKTSEYVYYPYLD